LREMDTVELTKKLVEINSVTGSEGEVCEFVKNYLEENGIKVEKNQVDDKRYNIIARTGSGEKKLILCSHFDTVPPHIPLSGKDGKLYGRGTCDAKCHIASSLNILIELSKTKLNGELIFVGVTAEEVGGDDGAKKVVEELGLKADAAIILEPMDLRLAIAQVGVIWADLEMTGKEMHVTQMNDEANVVGEMAKLVAKLHEEFPKKFNQDSLVGKPQFQVTVFKGGETTNVLAGKCIAKLDCRHTPNETKEQIYEFIDECINLSNLKVKPEVKETAYRPVLETNKENDIVKTFTKIKPDIELFGYEAVTDANYFSDVGIPSVIFGCGKMDVAHTRDEHVVIDDIKKEEEILKKVCEDFLN